MHPCGSYSYRQCSLDLLDSLKIQFFSFFFIKTSDKYYKIIVFMCLVNVLFYYHHKLHISLNSYRGHITLKESLRAAKRLLENVMKTFPSNSVRVGAEKRINEI